jgi:glycogen(starch) synthase
MKIALIPSAFHPSLGGVEELSRQLAHALKRRGHQVIVISDRWPRDLPENETFEGLQLFRLAMRAPEPNHKARLTFALTEAKTRKKMQQIVGDFGAEIMHLQCISTNGYYGLDCSEKLGVPLVVSAQGELTMDASGVYDRSNFLRTALLGCMERASALTACSQNALQDILDFYAQNNSSMLSAPRRTIYNGISITDFENIEPYQSVAPYIFAMGRFVPQKGFDVLIDAFQLADLADWQLVIAGDGVEKENLEKQVISLGLEDRVKFWGRASRNEVGALLKGAEFFVLPSRLEPMGIVNLEAMACGKAVLASHTGGVPEIVTHDVNGLLVAPSNAPLLAESLRLLGNNPQLRKTLGENGAMKAKEFDWDVIASKYEFIYREALEKKSRAPRLGVSN